MFPVHKGNGGKDQLEKHKKTWDLSEYDIYGISEQSADFKFDRDNLRWIYLKYTRISTDDYTILTTVIFDNSKINVNTSNIPRNKQTWMSRAETDKNLNEY